MVLLLAGGRGFPRREGLRRIKERLENVPGLSGIRYEPSRIRPRTVVADVDGNEKYMRPTSALLDHHAAIGLAEAELATGVCEFLWGP